MGASTLAAIDPAAWRPQTKDLARQVAGVPEHDRKRAAAAMLESLYEALQDAGVAVERPAAVPGVQLASDAAEAFSQPDPTRDAALARAQARGEARLVAWTRDGTLVDSATVAEAWAIRRQTLDAARARGEVFSLWVKGQHWYPAEMLKFERRAFAQLNAALGDADPSRKLLFLLHRHGALGGRTPADAAADQHDDVVRLAAGWSQD